jgi:hypothetical protein
VGDAKNIACTDVSDWLIMITKRCPINLAYKSPPREGHLSRTGHIGGTYMLVYTVISSNKGATHRLLLDFES